MADFFLDEPAAAPAAQVSDPAADFLAGEQADLAAIDNSANVVYDQVATEDFDPFGAQSAPPVQEQNDDFFIEQATVTPAAVPAPVVEAPPPAEPVAPVYTMPKIEPEIIKQWREDFKLRTEKIEADASQEADEWKAAAKEALDKFYADRDEKMEKTRKLNRESADALKVDESSYSGDNLENHEKWEHVTQSIDFNAKGSCTKDTTRMRQVLLQLKSGKSE